MHREYVERRRWIDDAAFSDLVALCQFLPGPASSQLGMAIGIHRAGLLGGAVAWFGFTLPSAILLVLFAYGVDSISSANATGWIHGLSIVAVPVVAIAVWGMASKLCSDRTRATIAIAAAIASIAFDGPVAQLGVIAVGGVVGWICVRGIVSASPERVRSPVSPRQALLAGSIFVALLVGLPLVAAFFSDGTIPLLARFYRAGSLVFGGGHVILPLLEAETVGAGWMTQERFLAGYGAAQAVPGPLLALAAYLGFLVEVGPGGILGACLALVAIFLPSYLLVVGALPFWFRLRASSRCQSILAGVNAAVVGILLAALFDPVWTTAIRTPSDYCVALAAFAALALWRWPPWLVVVLCALTATLRAQ